MLCGTKDDDGQLIPAEKTYVLASLTTTTRELKDRDPIFILEQLYDETIDVSLYNEHKFYTKNERENLVQPVSTTQKQIESLLQSHAKINARRVKMQLKLLEYKAKSSDLSSELMLLEQEKTKLEKKSDDSAYDHRSSTHDHLQLCIAAQKSRCHTFQKQMDCAKQIDTSYQDDLQHLSDLTNEKVLILQTLEKTFSESSSLSPDEEKHLHTVAYTTCEKALEKMSSDIEQCRMKVIQQKPNQLSDAKDTIQKINTTSQYLKLYGDILQTHAKIHSIFDKTLHYGAYNKLMHESICPIDPDLDLDQSSIPIFNNHVVAVLSLVPTCTNIPDTLSTLYKVRNELFDRLEDLEKMQNNFACLSFDTHNDPTNTKILRQIKPFLKTDKMDSMLAEVILYIDEVSEFYEKMSSHEKLLSSIENASTDTPNINMKFVADMENQIHKPNVALNKSQLHDNPNFRNLTSATQGLLFAYTEQVKRFETMKTELNTDIAKLTMQSMNLENDPKLQQLIKTQNQLSEELHLLQLHKRNIDTAKTNVENDSKFDSEQTTRIFNELHVATKKLDDATQELTKHKHLLHNKQCKLDANIKQLKQSHVQLEIQSMKIRLMYNAQIKRYEACAKIEQQTMKNDSYSPEQVETDKSEYASTAAPSTDPKLLEDIEDSLHSEITSPDPGTHETLQHGSECDKLQLYDVKTQRHDSESTTTSEVSTIGSVDTSDEECEPNLSLNKSVSEMTRKTYAKSDIARGMCVSEGTE